MNKSSIRERGDGSVAQSGTLVVDAEGVPLEGDWNMPVGARGGVLFAHGSGSSRHSPRNRMVARALQKAGMGTLLFDLLTSEEEIAEESTAYLRFDIPLLAGRLAAATRWFLMRPGCSDLAVGYFGASTGGAAALAAAARGGASVRAVVSRGGRPDLAGNALPLVRAPTLLVVGARDTTVLQLNRVAFARLRCEKDLQVIPGAGHLFEEPGALETVSALAASWFLRHLCSRG